MTILKLLEELYKAKFYGRLVLHFRDGKVAAAEKQENIKVEDSGVTCQESFSKQSTTIKTSGLR